MTPGLKDLPENQTNSGHGGNIKKISKAAGLSPDEILDFSANINPLNPPEWLRSVLSRNIENLIYYPDPDSTELVNAISKKFNVGRDRIVVGNGSTEIIFALPRALKVSKAVIPVPSYMDYVTGAEQAGLTVEFFHLDESRAFEINWPELTARLHGNEIVILGQPNNPTGTLFKVDEFVNIAKKNPSTIFVVDEAFADFVDGYAPLVHNSLKNVITIRSLTKFYAIPGLRLGFAIAWPEIAKQFRALMLPWTVNTLAQAVGAAALEDEEYAVRTREFVRIQRESLKTNLSGIPGIKVFPGSANYLLARLDGTAPDSMSGSSLAKRLLEDKIAIRVCNNFNGLDDRYFRVAVRTESENERLVSAILKAVGAGVSVKRKKQTPAIMFQGTASDAGKSILTSALCRILLRDGISVAPFKAQNMSLNSFVTRFGKEMGRAQVVQAQACGLDPDVRMNPVLLKPNSDTGSQIILNGKPVANMTVEEYIRFKPKAFAAARHAYDSLASEHDVIILEGAGSPAEVNLKHDDIVNMRMARYAAASVLIAGDIDRGGVFASFVGTMEVLAEWERNLVAGFIVNRFRGRSSLLKDAISYTEKHTGRPILGVIPYLKDLGLPEEDSVGYKSGILDRPRPPGDHVEIALIDLPHVSNFTDFAPLSEEPDVYLKIVRKPDELDQPDALIIPGSKNVISDFRYLEKSGLAKKILAAVQSGLSEIIGICGGYQMLGREIRDPLCLESTGRSLKGLCLLDLVTIFEKEKTLSRQQAIHVESGCEVHGYEIHHGQSRDGNDGSILKMGDKTMTGTVSKNNMIWGTYLHGIFDADLFRRWFIDRLRSRKGLSQINRVRVRYDLEPAFDRLADTVRAHLDMERIYRLLGL